jgi:hypothetical protein
MIIWACSARIATSATTSYNEILDSRRRSYTRERPNQPLNSTAHVSPFPLMIQLVLVTFTAVAMP